MCSLHSLGTMIFSTLLLYALTLVLYVDILTLAAEPNSDTRFFCIHSSDTTYKQIAINGTDMLKHLDLNLDFAFFVHGWQSSFDIENKDDTPYKIGLAWVKAQNINFCGVDWRALASDGYYDAALKHVKTVGKQLAAFIAVLKQLKVKIDSISIAGHSLGAHVSGYAGHLTTINELNKTKIGTIYGLDPAGPFFTFSIVLKGSDFRLSTNDANFVQVLHTTSTLGTSKIIGHADFIANGGNTQKACLDELLKVEEEYIMCSHSHAKDIFLSSFTHSCTGFIKVEDKEENYLTKFLNYFFNAKISNSDVYGIHGQKMYGVFKLNTSNSEPYCK